MNSRPSLARLTHLLQMADSQLPVGAFSFSNGLESAIAVGLVKDVESLRDFVITVMEQMSGVDGVALLAAHRLASEDDFQALLAADRSLLARKLNEETRTMSIRMGRKLAELGKKVLPAPTLEKWLEAIKEGEAPGNFAVGQGMLFADLGLSEEEAFAAHNYGTASTVLGASLRLMRVDHMQTQKILFEVSERADLEYQRVRSKSLDEMASYTPALDILAAVHVKAHVRLFMN